MSVAVKTMLTANQSPPNSRQNDALASPTSTSVKIGSRRGRATISR